MGKCPVCSAVVSSVKIEGISGDTLAGRSYHVLTYLCPYCQAVLGVGIDPIAVKTDTVDEILKRLGRN